MSPAMTPANLRLAGADAAHDVQDHHEVEEAAYLPPSEEKKVPL
jgi:hypothetical protein